MSGGVRVAADDRHARQGRAVFRSDDMDYSLAFGHERKEGCCTKFGNIAVQSGDLLFADRVRNAVVAQLPAGCRCVVVRCGNDRADTPDFAPSLTQAFKCLRAGDFMHQVAVYVKDGRAIFLCVDDVLVPNLVIKRACHGASQVKGEF